MSVREEDRQKTGCTGRGLGIAAAVGVGVGAALYYFLSKRPEQPDTEGSTSSAWAYNDHSALAEDSQINRLRDEHFRKRSWSLEECSICFEIMLKDQELMALPCTHNFHSQCIMPWLQEKQTCPNCRKDA